MQLTESLQERKDAMREAELVKELSEIRKRRAERNLSQQPKGEPARNPDEERAGIDGKKAAQKHQTEAKTRRGAK